MSPGSIDLVTLGRTNMDLFSQDIGADFEDISGFDAMVGGSPANIAMGASRLGSRTAMLSMVGNDRVGDFNLRFLADEGVDVSHIGRVEGKLSSLALLGVQPPSHFPLTFFATTPQISISRPTMSNDFPGSRRLPSRFPATH